MNLKSQNRKWIITSVVVIILIVTMTISDIYYSKLEKEFPLLDKNELVEGTITTFKSHFEYTYLEIDSNTKRLIRPTIPDKIDLKEFYNFIEIGDIFLHKKSANKVLVYRQNKEYEFLLVSQRN